MKLERDTILYRSLKWVYAAILSVKYYFDYIIRKLNFPNKFADIKKIQNTKCGKRCFIVATGPSLTMEDLRKLKDEDTFGMNSLCKVFPELGWETTYFGIQDFRVFKNFKKEINSLQKTTVFFGETIKNSGPMKTESFYYPINFLNHRFKLDTRSARFSSNCYEQVYDGYSIAYSLLQIAVYMGYKEIYLIGADCNYRNSERTHFIDNGNKSALDTGDRIIFAYGEAKKYCDSHGIKVYNTTRGGMLEVFPRIQLEEVL